MFETLSYGRGAPRPIVPGVLRTPDGAVNVRPKAMSRPRKAAVLLKSPVSVSHSAPSAVISRSSAKVSAAVSRRFCVYLRARRCLLCIRVAMAVTAPLHFTSLLESPKDRAAPRLEM